LNLFLDTSAIVKLYNPELETEELTKYVFQDGIEKIIISELAKIEFRSALWKKFREKLISEGDLLEVVELFSSETFYTIVPLSESIVNNATELLNRYGKKGLRTLDSIQLASILSANINKNLTAITFDLVLIEILKLEGISIYSKK
jgi:predicted nucleic acid-binding protein